MSRSRTSPPSRFRSNAALASRNGWDPPERFPKLVTTSQGSSRNSHQWPPIRDDSRLDALKVVKVDLRISENGEAHRTSKYELMQSKNSPKLVIRRSQDVSIDLHFHRKFNKDRDGVSFVFSAADGVPSMGHGTLVIVPLLHRTSDYWNSTPWSAFIGSIEGTRVEVQFRVSPKCPVGKWNIEVDTKLKERNREDLAATTYKFQNSIYILFNPWSEDDLVYMENEAWKQEYVLEEAGLIWRGTHNRLRPTPWNYSQFDRDILDCALFLLSGPGRLPAGSRGDPVKVSRVISAAVNSNDNNGLLVGNWSDKFEDGISPTQWTGSAKIMQKFLDFKKPVKFAQCWVFSGVLTTVARALGIPCRPVTNYSSAHDTQGSLTIDYFMDEDGKAIDSLNTDSVWNFHVWNEVWFRRPDLEDDKGREYSGWQVIDATPQEQSEQMFRCGPASVAAIRRGEILRPYDGTFVFSEVNSDKLFWNYRGPGAPLKLLSKNSDAIGMNISTKAVGKFEREDITDSYKFPENTEEERQVMLNALKQSESLFSRYYLNEDFNDIRFDFELIDDIIIGSPFRVILKIAHARGKRDYRIKVSLRVDTMQYTGKIKAQVKKQNYLVLLAPDTDEEVVLTVSYDEYAPKLSDQCSFNIACLAKVQDTTFEYFAQDDFRLRKPDIKFIIHADNKNSIFVGESLKLTVKFKNPLPVKLTKGEFQLEAPGLSTPLKVKLKKSVEPGEFADAEFTLIPRREGEKMLTAKFTSTELEDVDGFATITVNTSNKIIR